MSRFEWLVWRVVLTALLAAVTIAAGSLLPRSAELMSPVAALVVGVGGWRFLQRYDPYRVAGAFRAAIAAVRVAFNRLVAFRLFLGGTTSVLVRGIRVAQSTPPDAQRMLATMDGAIRLIEFARPARAMRLRRIDPLLLISSAGPTVSWSQPAAFIPGANLIVMLDELVGSGNPTAVAALLLHELVHALIDTRAPLYHPRVLDRGEFIASREMREFVRRLLESGSIEQRLCSEDDLRWVIDVSRQNLTGRRFWTRPAPATPTFDALPPQMSAEH